MKKIIVSTLLAAVSLMISPAIFAQEKERETKADQFDEIIIKKKSDRDSKVTIEIKEGEVTVNGKPLADYEDENIAVIMRKMPYISLALPYGRFRQFGMPEDWDSIEGDSLQQNVESRGFLGVAAGNSDDGVVVQEVTASSAAETAGLKKGDIILKVDAEKIETPADLSRVIRSFKPGEDVTITYKRDGKNQKTSVMLGKRPTQNTNKIYRFRSPKHLEPLPGIEHMPELGNLDFNWREDPEVFGHPGNTEKPRLGIKAQDSEQDNGANVLEVKSGSAAEKAGLKAGDLITRFDGKAVNSADTLVEAARESRPGTPVTVEVLRNGKQLSLEITYPRKLKTANL